MRLKTVLRLCAFALMVIAAACKKHKDENEQPVIKTKRELLTAADWHLAKIERNPAGAGFADFPLPDCSKDDRLTFGLNDTVMLKVNTTCLFETDDTSKWEFQDGEKTLYYFDQPFILNNLNTDSLTVTLVEAPDSTRSTWVH